jgi:predicted transglutaminase-like cysteine proteinase
MFERFATTAVVVVLFELGICGQAQSSEINLPSASYIQVGGETSLPYGWMDFCNRRPEECNLGKLEPRDVQLTTKTWGLLNLINNHANEAIDPVSNLDHWGTLLDHWDYPVDGMGDCKIYALYKRKLLIEEGFPRQALLMTIVRDLNDEGHAILTVRTDHGEFVLDNHTNQIRPWDATGYRYIKRQAQDDPNVWLDLGGVLGAPAARADEMTADDLPKSGQLNRTGKSSTEKGANEFDNPSEQPTRSDWLAQVRDARARHDAWLTCILGKRSDCDGAPTKDPVDSIGDDGLPRFNIG